MLKTRVITAIVLLVAFLTALFVLPALGWVAVVTLIAALAAWEWGALMRFNDWQRIATALSVVVVCLALTLLFPEALGLTAAGSGQAWQLGRWLYLPSAAFWLLLAPFWLRGHWLLRGRAVGLAVGALLILPTWLSLIQLKSSGALLLIAVMATVWLADIAAFFAGRRFGRHKLAPAISPGKTWEGAFGAALAVLAYGWALASHLPAAIGGNAVLLSAALLAFTAISIMGDLFESLLKRQAGLKDSSNILPGHGGVLDRIDSLTSTLPMAALIWLYSLS